VLLEAVVLEPNASFPTAVLLAPVVFASKEKAPTLVLSDAVVLDTRAF
jgi:hypothetical protein